MNPATDTFHTVNFQREIEIAAPLATSFQAVLDELGPQGQMPDGSSFPMKLEPWPGGRWFRDLGNAAGHFWGHVQVIKPPTLIELCGPMFMSYPAHNFVQYRLAQTPSGTRLLLTHRAMGLIPLEHQQGMELGFAHGLNRVKQLAEHVR